MDKTRFLALIQREWLQHRTGWLLVAGVPTLLLMLAAVLGITVFQVQLSGDNGGPFMGIDLGDGQAKVALADAPAALHTLIWSAALPAVTVLLVLMSVALQLPGLARRDVQDRSIEFWRSLPIHDGAALAATLLTHLVLLPAAALLAALLGAQLLALLTVTSTQGLWAWLSQPWWQLLPAIALVALRLVLALLLALLWLSPLLLLTMAASAWFKRWGVPLLALTLVLGVQVLDRLLPQPAVGPTLNWLLGQAQTALFSLPLLPGVQIARAEDVAPFVLPDLPGWALRDGWAALQHLATPGLLPVLLTTAGCFWLLLRRRRLA